MRWRDTKKGRITAKKEKVVKQKLSEFTISPPINRIKAFITDTFMLMMPILYIVFYLVMGSREEFEQNMLMGWIYTVIPHFLIIISFYYFKGQTPGYKSYDIKLVDNNLKKPSLSKLTVIYIVFTLSIFLFAGLIFCFLRKDKKNLHDLISGTMPIQIKS
jgi:uncharacterized RDD family membrane protein YckC